MQTAQAITSTFNTLDWALLLIVVFSALMAFRRGLIGVVFSFAGLILGILVAAWEYVGLANYLTRWIVSTQTAQIVAFLVILFAVMFLAGILAGLLRKAVKTIGLSFLDRLGGAVFGLARGVLLGAAIIMAIAAFSPESTWAENSTLAPYFLAGFHAVSFVVPKDFEQQIAKGASVLMHETPDLMRPHTLPQAPE